MDASIANLRKYCYAVFVTCGATGAAEVGCAYLMASDQVLNLGANRRRDRQRCCIAMRVVWRDPHATPECLTA
jgi:hypothetical protein